MLAFANDDFADFASVIARYVDTTGLRPDAAVLGVAAPLDRDVITLTNRDWRFRLDDLKQQFGWREARAINDFEAIAWSLPRLMPADLHALGGGESRAEGTKVALGPGTGMGVAALLAGAHGPQALPTEGGHVSFGPALPDEDPVFARLRAERGGPVSAEMVLSGSGLERLHRALHPHADAADAEAIGKAAAAGDAAAAATVALFVRLLGRFAGDLALTFKATGGVYIAGGVARHLRALLDDETFRTAFEDHPPYRSFLRDVATMLITLDEPGLLGCAAVATMLPA
jgi:glucokinase